MATNSHQLPANIAALAWNDCYGTSTASALDVEHLQGQSNRTDSTNRQFQNFNEHNVAANWPDAHQQSTFTSNANKQFPYSFGTSNSFLTQQPELQVPMSLPLSTTTPNEFGATFLQQQQSAHGLIIPPTSSTASKATNPTASLPSNVFMSQHHMLTSEKQIAVNQNNAISHLQQTNQTAAMNPHLFQDSASAFYYDQHQQQPYTFYSSTPSTSYDNSVNRYSVSTSSNQPALHHVLHQHHQAHTPPESVSPKSAANISGSSRGLNASFSPHSSSASNSSPLSSVPSSAATGAQQQVAVKPQRTNAANKRARHSDYSTPVTAIPAAPQKLSKCKVSAPRTFASDCASYVAPSAELAATSAAYASNAYVAPSVAQFPLAPSSVQDFDQFSSNDGCGGGFVGDGDLRSLNENPIKFQHYQLDRWAPLYDMHCQPIEFTTLGVDADKGFNYSMYDQVHVCQKKNHFQISCQFQTSAPPCYVGFCPLPLDMSRACIVDIHLNMYGIKLDAPDQKVRLQQSKPDRSKKDYQPLRIEGLGHANSVRHQSSSGDLSLLCEQQQYSGVKLNIGRLHFADTTMNNMRKKGKPNRSQQYFALVVELSARDAAGNTHTLLSMISDKCIVRASNPGQFESNLDVTWLKSPNCNADSIFHQGKVGINVEKPTEALEVRGNIKLIGGHLLQPSDRRIKTDIQPLDPREQLANVTKMKVYKYRYKDGVTQALGLEDEHGEFHEIGFLAQEVAAVIPDAVEISGDLTLVNGETIENLLVVNKERVFIDTVAAVGELNRVLDEVVGRLERMERAKPKNRSSLSRSDSLRSITSSVTQISNRLRMLVPSSSMSGDDLSSHYGNITANSRRLVESQPPLNEADEDEEEKRSAKTAKTCVTEFDDRDGTLSALDSISQKQQKQKNCKEALGHRLSLSSSSSASTATTDTWRKSDEFDKAHSLALPTRKKALQQIQPDSSSSIAEKNSNFYIVCHRPRYCSWWLSSRNVLLLLASLICIALFSGLISLIIVSNNKSADHSIASTNALIYPLSSSRRTVLSDEELLKKYKMLPKMLTRAQTIEECHKGAGAQENLNDDKCAREYERHIPLAEMCCSLSSSGGGSGSASNSIQNQQQFLYGMGLINKQAMQIKQLQAVAAASSESNFPHTLASAAPRINTAAFSPSTAQPRSSTGQASSLSPSRAKAVAAAMLPTRESPRFIIEAPLPHMLIRREISTQTTNESPDMKSDSEKFNVDDDFQLLVPALNLTLDRTFCSQSTKSKSKSTACAIQIPLQADFPLMSFEATLDTRKASKKFSVDLCEANSPVACNEVERIKYQQLESAHSQQKSWSLPVGFYVSSSYKFVIAEGDFASTLGGVCSLLSPSNNHGERQEENTQQNKRFILLDVEFKRVCA